MTADAPAPRCADCRFFAADSARRGTCRFEPPQWYFVNEKDCGWDFPVLAADDDCGQFQRRTP
jgi:hypothetical protein